MSKRKTRQQKIIADLRRKVQINQPIHASEVSSTDKEGAEEIKTFTFSAPRNTTFTQSSSTFNTTSLLLPDLQKTGIVTSAIIIGEVVLFFLLKQHIIAIPFVNY